MALAKLTEQMGLFCINACCGTNGWSSASASLEEVPAKQKSVH